VTANCKDCKAKLSETETLVILSKEKLQFHQV